MQTQPTAFVTGGATGIGLALVEALLEENYQVVICGRRQEVLDAAVASHENVVAFQADLSHREGVKRAAEHVKEHFPQLSLLINNAGLTLPVVPGDADTSIANFEEMTYTNLVAPSSLTLLLADTLQANQGTVVYVSSGLAFTPRAAIAMYSATKAAVHSLALSHRHVLAPRGIRVVELAPPAVKTDFHNGTNRNSPMSIEVDQVSKDFIEGLKAGKDEILVGFAARLYAERDQAFPMVNAH